MSDGKGGGWAECRMCDGTELAGGYAVILRTGWPAEVRSDRWTVERCAMAAWSATVWIGGSPGGKAIWRVSRDADTDM